MGTTRFKGETASERLNFESISDSDMIQIRHLPGTLNDTDKGISKAQLMSCPFGVCDTAANTALKTVSLVDSNPDFVLVSGREVVIYFANANTETSPVINFEGSGSYPLFSDNGSPVGTWAAGTWMHLKFFSVEINDTLIQRWILLSPLPVDAVTANNMQSVTSNAVYSIKQKVDRLYDTNLLNKVSSLPLVSWRDLPSQSTDDNIYFQEWYDWMIDHGYFGSGTESYIGLASPNYLCTVWGFTYEGADVKNYSSFVVLKPTDIARFGYDGGQWYYTSIH